MTPPMVTVVVVSFNTKDKLRRCLGCIEPQHEVIVVDNASVDGSADMVATDFPHVTLIRNTENLGFGEANDQGFAAASGEAVLFLNSDAYAFPGAIEALASAVVDDVAAVGGRQLNLDGSLQESSANELTLWAVLCEQFYLDKVLKGSRTFNPYWNSRSFETTSECLQVMGATLMVNRRLIQEKADAAFRPWAPGIVHEGIFDPRYFLYCEDTDLCRRLRTLGRILYVPDAKFTHELGSSSLKDRWRSVARYNRGKELYFQIHHGFVSAIGCWMLDRLGALLRLVTWILAFPKSAGRISLFWRVLTAPIQGPPDPRRR